MSTKPRYPFRVFKTGYPPEVRLRKSDDTELVAIPLPMILRVGKRRFVRLEGINGKKSYLICPRGDLEKRSEDIYRLTRDGDISFHVEENEIETGND